MHQYPDKAMRQRAQKNAHSQTLRVLTVGFAIIAAYWLLSTTTRIPAQSCTVQTFDGQYGTYNECGR